MDLKKLDKKEANRGLDGSLVSVDTDATILTPNKNFYFLGVIVFAVGAGMAGYGIYKFLTAASDILATNAGYIFLSLGGALALAGLILVFKALAYLCNLKRFLKIAKYTKCNIKCVTEIRGGRKNKRDDPIRTYYTLRVDYIDSEKNQMSKIIRWILAYDLYKKMKSYFKFEGEYFSLDNHCLVAYNGKGKIILVYNYIVGRN